MTTQLLNRRALATIAVALVAAIGSVAGVSFAQGSGGGSAGAATSATNGKATASPAPGGILAGVHAALERLVASGTISQQQADAVQRQANAGSIDPKTLVQHGVVSDAQMRAIGNSIDQVKRAAGN